MTKRNTLAVVIPTLLVVGITNATEVYNKDGGKIDIYGKVAGPHYLSKHNGNNAHVANGDQTYACLGFKGETQANDQLTGYGQWGHQFSGNNAEGGDDAQKSSKTRPVSAGLKFGDAGSFGYGHNHGVVYDALDYIDMLPGFGGDTAASDQLFSQCDGSLATYRNSSLSSLVENLNLAVQYLDKSRHSSSPARFNGDGVSGSTGYEIDGFGIVDAYDAVDRTNVQEQLTRDRGTKVEQWATGVEYSANSIYLTADYSEVRDATRTSNGYANKTKDVLLAAQYQLDFSLCPSLAYVKSKGRDIEGIGDIDLVNYFEIGATYYFNKDMSIYVDYITDQINPGNELGIGSDDIVAVGIVYQF